MLGWKLKQTRKNWTNTFSDKLDRRIVSHTNRRHERRRRVLHKPRQKQYVFISYVSHVCRWRDLFCWNTYRRSRSIRLWSRIVLACGVYGLVRGKEKSFLLLKSKQNEKKEFSFEVLLYNNNNKMHYLHVYINIHGPAFLNCLFYGNELCPQQVFNVVWQFLNEVRPSGVVCIKCGILTALMLRTLSPVIF